MHLVLCSRSVASAVCMYGTLAKRSFATLKDIQLRLKSVKSIEKITKSMKMIAATKLNRAQKAMEVGRFFGERTLSSLQHLKVPPPNDAQLQATANEPQSATQKELLIVCSSDRGLCGAIHTALTKKTKEIIASKLAKGADLATAPLQIVVLGDKARGQLSRDFGPLIAMSVSNVGRHIPTFEEAAGVARTILQHFPDATYPRKSIIYNRFVSVLAYEAVVQPIASPTALLTASNWNAYEAEAADVQPYAEFLFASLLFRGLVEGHAAEMAAKRASMDNATKNAGEIIGRLTMQYNQTRQAVITNELVDIITGASAL